VKIIVLHLAMAAKEAYFCDRCCNLGHFLCSVLV